MPKAAHKVVVIGHRNPDTDSICSAIAYAELKNKTSSLVCEPRRAGRMNQETEFVLKKFGVTPPRMCTDVNPKIRDVDFREMPGINGSTSLRKAWEIMRDKQIDTLPITDADNELLGLIKEEVRRMFGEHPLDNEDYGHIVNAKHFARVRGLIDPDKVVLGGTARESSLKIEPTILDGVTPDDAVMQEEIFGPILPVLTFENLDEVEAFITDRPTPLALYIFSQDRAVQQRFVRYVPFGGGCVNDTIMHLATSHMGFGGMGASGMGQYHGRESFDTFSHKKSIVNKATWLDVPFRYAPYASWKHKFVRMFVH